MRHFKNPSKEFRPAPFWAWNDRLDARELTWQIEEMADKGFGGYFMHSRVGLATRFLGPEWMAAVAACIKAGKRCDMESWLYDEDKWPSGIAGGLVTRGHPEHAAKLLMEDLRCVRGRSYLACFDWDARRRRYRRLGPDERPGDAYLGYWADNVEAAVSVVKGRFWWGYNDDQMYPDLLDGDAVEAFLRIGYAPYARRFKKSFGEYVPGIFTDEPHVARPQYLAWTARLPETFQHLNGYDLLDRLPDLHHDTPTAFKTRHDYWRTVAHLFRESFSRKLYERCQQYGLKLTGHYLLETPLADQAVCSGAVMPLYTYQHMPGIDHLVRGDAQIMHIKQVTSAAAQLGRKRIMCEIFGCSGHSMSFQDQKWLSDLHFVNGVNFLTPHLTLYSMKGDNKRDYPPTLSYHQPYWEHYRQINDYIGRCCVAVSTGAPRTDILVLHPISSVWCHMRARDDALVADRLHYAPAADRLDDKLARLIEHLVSIQRDFHFGDETLLEELARLSGKTLRVGRMTYRAMIVPPSLTWRTSTVEMLKAFQGPILFVGAIPTLVDAEKSDVWSALLKRKNVRRVPLRRTDIENALAVTLAPDVCVQAPAKARSAVRYHHRQSGKTHLYFFTNTGRKRAVRGRITLAEKGCVHELDARTGDRRPLPSRAVKGKTILDLDLPPAGSCIVELRPGPAGRSSPPQTEVVNRTLIRGPFALERTHPNCATLDYARVRIGAGRFSSRLPLYAARDRLRRHFGLDAVAGLQPWVLKERGFSIPKKTSLALQYDFHVTDMPARIAFATECPERWRMRINGRLVRFKPGQWFVDKQFGCVDITRRVTRGHNLIESTARYDWDLPVEDAYLVGDFAVKMIRAAKAFTLIREPAHLNTGDWVPQGYAFYSGNMVYRARFNLRPPKNARVFLALKHFEGVTAHLRLNGIDCGALPFPPWEIDITRAARNGDNHLALTVAGSLRNTMGPLHHRKDLKFRFNGPHEFADQKNWTHSYHFEPYGLSSPIQIITRTTPDP